MRPLSVTWIALILCAFNILSAQTTWTGVADSDWTNSANWSAGVPSNINSPALVPSAAAANLPIINTGVTVDYDVNNFNQITIAGNASFVNSTVVNGGDLIINPAARMNLDENSTMTNNGQVDINGTLHNLGEITNSGTIATIGNGVLFNQEDAFVTNNLTFNNAGSTSNFGTFINAGTISNDGLVTNYNNFDNGFGSTFNNGTGMIAGTVINYSTFGISGDFTTTVGLLENHSSLNIQSSATVVNNDVLDNIGTTFIAGGNFTNAGTFINRFSIINDFTTTFTNSGSLTNGLCALILHQTANAIAGGTVINNGIIYRSGSDVSVDSGSGIKLNTLLDRPTPTAICNPTFSATLDASDMVSISPSDINNGSSVPYCGIESMSLSISDFDCSHVGDNVVTLTVRDSLGNPGTCTSTITIIDAGVPEIVFCPSDLTVDLLPTLCEERVFYPVAIATDNCSSMPVVTQISPALESGDMFPVGVTEVVFVADDGTTTDTCRFDITVNDFQPFSNTLTCTSNAQLSVDLDCVSDLHPSMVLLGVYGCWDRFETVIKGTNETVITTDHIGQTITIMVTDTLTGNSCWSRLLIEDKGGPAITGCTDAVLFCVENPLPVSEGGVVADPTFQDCSGYRINYYDDITHNDCSDTYLKEIARNWLATDDDGNTSTCVQNILIRTVDLASMSPVCPADYSKECVYGQRDSLDPIVTGYPSIDLGGNIYELDESGGNICNIKATFRDDTLATSCGAALKIIRTWTILDCCASNTILWTCSQKVNFTDTTDPQVFLPPVVSETVDNNNNCTSRPDLPAAIVRDCSPYSVLIMTPVGVISSNGGQVPAPGLPAGINIVTYLVTDDCGNTTTRDMTVRVIDERPPVPVCRTFSTVSLTTGGTAVIKADSLNAGSTDECCLDTPNAFSVRRMTDNCMMPIDTVFGPEITLCCADAADDLMVVLRVTDCAGNFNDCMVTLTVDNKLPPTISCPPNLAVDCGFDYLDLDATGRVIAAPGVPGLNDGFATDNCGSILPSFVDDVRITCGRGQVLRTWTATDMTGTFSSCLQTISFTNSTPFDGDTEIVWPNDTLISNCNLFPDTSITGVPRYIQDACDNVIMTFRDDTLRTVTGDAVKILRYWNVTDWCQFVANDPTRPGEWLHTQVIEVSDPEPPVLVGCSSKLFCNENANCQPLLVDLSITVTDNCTDDDELTVNWVVDAFGDGIPDTGNEFSGTGMNDSNSYPNGTHEICYTVTDGFNNRSTCCFLFKIIDCKAPVATCRNSIQTLMASGMVPVNIMNFNNNGSSDNCTPTTELFYSFSQDINDTLRNFSCLNLGDNPIDFWVTDDIGNQTVCNTNLEIQDPMNVCSGSTKVAITGITKDQNGNGVSDVQMTISGQGQATIKTDNAGQFQFTNIPAGNDYSLTPVKNEDLRNGVSTLDIIHISRHLLNVELLDSPYKIIAADINNSRSVSTLDLVEMRKIILHVQDEFSNGNTSWRFIDKDQIFLDPTNPFAQPYKEVLNLNNLNTNELTADFVAIKIGDVNGDAVPNELLGVDDRTFDETINLTTTNQSFEKGDLITVTVSSEGNKSLSGLQATINFDADKLQLAEIIDGNPLSRENFGLTLLDGGVITLSGDNTISQTLEHEQTLFCLQFQTLATGNLSEWLSLSSNYTSAEAYASDGSRYNLDLKFLNGAKTGKEFVLYQNKPNPFAETTVVGFDLPESSNATLTVFDLSGKILNRFEDAFDAGYNEFRIEKDMLNATGILYYRLDTPTNSATRKMIVTGK